MIGQVRCPCPIGGWATVHRSRRAATDRPRKLDGGPVAEVGICLRPSRCRRSWDCGYRRICCMRLDRPPPGSRLFQVETVLPLTGGEEKVDAQVVLFGVGHSIPDQAGKVRSLINKTQPEALLLELSHNAALRSIYRQQTTSGLEREALAPDNRETMPAANGGDLYVFNEIDFQFDDDLTLILQEAVGQFMEYLLESLQVQPNRAVTIADIERDQKSIMQTGLFKSVEIGADISGDQYPEPDYDSESLSECIDDGMNLEDGNWGITGNAEDGVSIFSNVDCLLWSFQVRRKLLGSFSFVLGEGIDANVVDKWSEIENLVRKEVEWALEKYFQVEGRRDTYELFLLCCILNTSMRRVINVVSPDWNFHLKFRVEFSTLVTEVVPSPTGVRQTTNCVSMEFKPRANEDAEIFKLEKSAAKAGDIGVDLPSNDASGPRKAPFSIFKFLGSLVMLPSKMAQAVALNTLYAGQHSREDDEMLAALREAFSTPVQFLVLADVSDDVLMNRLGRGLVRALVVPLAALGIIVIGSLTLLAQATEMQRTVVFQILTTSLMALLFGFVTALVVMLLLLRNKRYASGALGSMVCRQRSLLLEVASCYQ
eukprot:scaffold6123_cov350-Prasinococcus_capsulatus_cf.AAC.2